METLSGSFRAPFTVELLADGAGRFQLRDADGKIASTGKIVASGTVAGYVTITGLPGLGALRVPADLVEACARADALPTPVRQVVRNELLAVGLGGVYTRPISLHGRPNSPRAVAQCRAALRDGAEAAGVRVRTRRQGPVVEALVTGVRGECGCGS